MAIYQHKGRKNEWRIQVTAPNDPATGKRRRPSEIFRGSKSEAKKRETKLKSLIDSGRHVDRNATTLSDYAKLWFTEMQGDLAPTTIANYARLLNNHVVPQLGKFQIQQITAANVREFLGSYLARGKKSMAEHLFVFLKLFFKAAFEDDVIRKIPLKGVVHPKAQPDEMRVLSPEEWHRISYILETESSDALAIFTVSVMTGIRRSELAGLQWMDIDFDRATIHVRRSYHVVNGRGLYKAPKTVRSTRAIKLGAETVRVLLRQRETTVRLADLAERPIPISGPVFTPDGVKPYSPDSLTHKWQRIRTIAGLSGVRLQDLRHTNATILLANGTSVGTVGNRLGHASPKTTLDVYWHAVPGEQETAAASLDAILSPRVPDADVRSG